MALDPDLMGAVYSSALGAIRRDGTRADLGAIARQLQQQFGQGGQQPYIDFLNAVMAADRNWRQATVAQEDPSRVERRRDIPVDPTLTRGSGLVQYRVVVVATDEFGRRDENLVVILSATPISGQEAVDRAIAEVQSNRVVRTTNPRGRQTGEEATFSGIVQSVGQAGR